MNWEYLKCLLAVHRTGSVLRAATELEIDRASVFRRISALEDSLDARLVHRTRTGCTLTEAGLRVIAAVEDMEHAASSVRGRVAGEDRQVRGKVRITGPEGFMVSFLIPKLPELVQRHPDLEVHAITGDRVLDLGRREADIALRNQRPKKPDLVIRRVPPFGFALFASPTYIAQHGTPRRNTWHRHSLLTYEPNQTYLPGVAWLTEHAKAARVVFRCNETLPVLAAARTGMGIALLPVLMGDPDPALVRVPPGLLGETPELWLVVQSEVHAMRRIRVVYDFIASALEHHSRELRGV